MILKTVFYVIIWKWLPGISNNSLIVFNDNFVIITTRSVSQFRVIRSVASFPTGYIFAPYTIANPNDVNPACR